MSIFPEVFRDPTIVEKPFWEPIGRYVFQFGYLERDVDWSLSALLKLEYITHGQVLFSQISSLPSKLKLLSTLTRKATSSKGHRDAIDDLIDLIDEQRQFRNSLVHGGWGNYSEQGDLKCWQKIEISGRIQF